jgi:hypothetical protein
MEWNFVMFWGVSSQRGSSEKLEKEKVSNHLSPWLEIFSA